MPQRSRPTASATSSAYPCRYCRSQSSSLGRRRGRRRASRHPWPCTPGARRRRLRCRRRSMRLTLFHFLLDHASERKQPLVDGGGNLADEPHHLVAVLENAGLPDQLVAERLDLSLIARRGALERLELDTLLADLVGG